MDAVERRMECTGSGAFVRRGGAAHVDQTFHVTALALGALVAAA
ncbi:hypothetical protein ACIBBE_24060 [Streptomyces sp. NPDC051644]